MLLNHVTVNGKTVYYNNTTIIIGKITYIVPSVNMQLIHALTK